MRIQKQFITFLILGGALTVLEWLLFYVLTYWFTINYILANIITFVLFSFIGMHLYKKMIFLETHLQYHYELFLTYTINLFGLCFQLAIIYLCIHILQFEKITGKIIASFFSALLGFLLRKIWIYKERNCK